MKLCCKHRQLAHLSSEQAELMWRRLTQLGEEKILAQEWNAAVSMFGSALEITEILLMLGKHNTRDTDLERYLVTLTLFIECLGNSQCTTNYETFYHIACEKLREENTRMAFGQNLETVFGKIHEIFASYADQFKGWQSASPAAGMQPAIAPNFLH